MSKPVRKYKFAETTQLNVSERLEIDRKIELETLKLFNSMVKLGALANIVGALFYVLTMYETTNLNRLLIWYSVLVTASMCDVWWGSRFNYNKLSYDKVVKCRNGFLVIITWICLTWSSIGILFMPNDAHQQITTVIFLAAVLICFTFATVIDLTIGIASIISLLAPTTFYNFYLAIHFWHTNQASTLSMPIATAFLILGLFLLLACILGNKLIVKVFRLGYENALLSQKLENNNLLLEQRVQERTEELQKSLKLVTYQATHDLLTELPNERLLYEHLSSAMEQSTRTHQKVAIICFSLNNMIKINDSLGNQAATTIIRRIAQRFIQKIQDDKKYFIALSRKDVFIIVIHPVDEINEVELHVSQLFTILDNPIYIEKQSLHLTGSAGVSIFPADGRDPNTLISNAEAARTLATQRGGKSVCIYNTIINADATRQLYIENYLFRAVEKNELILNYQPFIDLRTGSVCGAEALVRWNSPELGLVSPLDFIPIAESNGLILPIGAWVLRTACNQVKAWHALGYSDFRISVNLSAKQLLDPHFSDSLEKLLRELKLAPQYLELELTESNAFQNESIPVINKFAEMGISLAIDDFGTGYSELSNLKLFNVNKIKIDKSFIQDIDVSIDSRSIVSHTIALAKRLEIDCLAEGVETIEQVEFLKEQGCNYIQGYYFSKPLSEKDFLKFMENFSLPVS